ncbi:ABC transporter substrate-binding protein [Bacillus sp. FJAT-50079]|uniref:ABC transporter substrate-binding protein n=1 Tax=Bacillus sp. FJAT-50079 TaxID=2833577 RepID=UPI001BCA00F5|nr:ABC transporter substrate-binding protein [Bacillus sp. FJAT-50079]MBS4206579.1 carbohydrate ABC transporter substrate-binding protein [Bacillus sp. FJAT-50079]
MKQFTWGLFFAVLILLLIGCSNTNRDKRTAPTKNELDQEQVTLKIFNFKVEMAEQLDMLVQEYEVEHPEVNILMETCGGGCDYSSVLKTKFSSGDKPDIFFVAGYNDLDLWIEQLEDLSDQPWAEDVFDFAKDPMTKDGKLYGMPLNIEGWGYIYNKDLFEQAGITQLPKTLSELTAAVESLEKANITPFMNGYGEWWILGNHFLNIGFAQQENPIEYVEAVKQGTEKFKFNKTFNDWVNLLDVTIKYGNSNPLQTDYNTQVTSFASGQAAMIQQGNWIEIQLLKLNPDFEYGYLPMPINDDAETMDRLPVGVANSWVVHKNSTVKEEAKEFINWIATSDIGKRYIIEEFKFIPALETIEVDRSKLGPLASDIVDYMDNNKTIPWLWQRYPGYEANSAQMASAIQAYIGGGVTKEEMFEQFQKIWDGYSEQEE